MIYFPKYLKQRVGLLICRTKDNVLAQYAVLKRLKKN